MKLLLFASSQSHETRNKNLHLENIQSEDETDEGSSLDGEYSSDEDIIDMGRGVKRKITDCTVKEFLNSYEDTEKLINYLQSKKRKLLDADGSGSTE